MATLKEWWLQALRSGKYNQAHGRLKAYLATPDDPSSTLDHNDLESIEDKDLFGMCCLGVLADVINPGGWKHDERHCEDENGDEVLMELAAWTHSLSPEGELLDRGVDLVWKEGEALWGGAPMNHLATMNDEGADFKQIAIFIEDNIDVMEDN